MDGPSVKKTISQRVDQINTIHSERHHRFLEVGRMVLSVFSTCIYSMLWLCSSFFALAHIVLALPLGISLGGGAFTRPGPQHLGIRIPGLVLQLYPACRRG